MTPNWRPLAILVLVFILGACTAPSSAPTPTPIPTLSVPQKPTYTVQKGTVSRTLEMRGRVSAVRQEDLFFKVSGVVEEVLVSRGESVQAGQPLAYLAGRQDFQMALADAALEVLRAEQALASLSGELVLELRQAEAWVAYLEAQSAVEDARKALTRLYLPTPGQLTLAEARLALAEVRLEEARLKYESSLEGPDPYQAALAENHLQKARVNLQKVQANLDNLEITAPFDGLALSISLLPGMQVAAFKPVMTVVDPGGLEISLLPTPAEMADLSAGQAARVIFSNRPGQEFPARVRYVPLSPGASGEPAGDQSVRVALDEGEQDLLVLGEIATVIVEIEKRQDVLWLPPAALRTFQGRDFVIYLDGEIQRRADVRLGLRGNDRVEILEGLSPGQIVLGP
jgi:RND family efflux transporter MFP subunit